MSKTAMMGIGVLVLLIAVLALSFDMRQDKNTASDMGAPNEYLMNETASVDAELQELENDRQVIDEGLQDSSME